MMAMMNDNIINRLLPQCEAYKRHNIANQAGSTTLSLGAGGGGGDLMGRMVLWYIPPFLFSGSEFGLYF